MTTMDRKKLEQEFYLLLIIGTEALLQRLDGETIDGESLHSLCRDCSKALAETFSGRVLDPLAKEPELHHSVDPIASVGGGR
jgi:hypothetical protein